VYADFAAEPKCAFTIGAGLESVGERMNLAALCEALSAKVRELIGA
jgi:hypothetical protein